MVFSLVAIFALIFLLTVALVVVVTVVKVVESRNSPARVDVVQSRRPAKPARADADEPDYWATFISITGVTLFCFAMIGVLSLAKGLGAGAAGKGLTLLGFVCVSAIALGLVAALRHGNRFVRSLVLGLGGIVVCSLLAAGLFFVAYDNKLLEDVEFVASRVYDEVIDDFGQAWEDQRIAANDVNEEMSELGAELSAEMSELADELGLSAPKIPILPVTPVKGDAEDSPPTPPEAPELESEEEPTADAANDMEVNADDKADEPSGEIPLWSGGDWSPEPTRIESDPFVREEEARIDVSDRLRLWLLSYAVQANRGQDTGWIAAQPDEVLWERFVTDQQKQEREMSFGKMVVLSVTAELDSEDADWVLAKSTAWEAAERRERGLRLVTAGGVGALTLLGAAYGALSLGSKKQAA